MSAIHAGAGGGGKQNEVHLGMGKAPVVTFSQLISVASAVYSQLELSTLRAEK